MDWTSIIVALIALFGGGGGFLTLILQRRWTKQDKGAVGKDDMDNLIGKVDKISERLSTVETSVADNTALTAAVANAQRVITTERVRYLGMLYLSKGEIAVDDKVTLNAMHEAGERLGLDGTMDAIMDLVNGLPVKEARFSRKET